MNKIRTDYWAKPIPMRQFDWQATYDGDEPSDAGAMDVGYGHTEAEAVADLVENYPREVYTVAPSLLAAARQAADALRSYDPGNPRDETGWAFDDNREAWSALNAAIAKAEGVQS